MSVILEYSGQFAHLTLDRPRAMNALSFGVLRELKEKLEAVGRSKARGLVLTGAGDKSFCAGADIPELVGRALMDELEGAALGQDVFNLVADLRIPSVAVIHGYAFGGGLELALACTFRVATASARMGLPEVRLGLIPGYGGTQRLPRLIGEARATEIILSGRSLEAHEAERIGLVNRVDDEGTPFEIGQRLLEPILRSSLCALYFAREAVQRGSRTGLADGLRLERDLSTLCYRTEDASEGLNAFVEKRKPTFKDC